MKNIEEILKHSRNELPDINKRINFFRKNFIHKIPSYCFFTEEIWIDLLKTYKIELINVYDYTIYRTIFTWQYSKYIFKFNKVLYNSIINTKINKDLPYDILFRLPQTCIYIELDDDNFLNINDKKRKLNGFFVLLTQHQKKDIIYFIPNLQSDNENVITISTYPLLLEKGNIVDIIENSVNSSTNFNNFNFDMNVLSELYNKFLALIIYICSSEPDIICHEKIEREHQPIIKTRHGEKLLPAPKVKIFNVGDEIAKKIQEVNDYESGDKSVRAHIRKAHWHGYWIGKGRTEFKYNWIHPMLINVENTMKELPNE